MTNTVLETTVDSATWTLSENWNDTTSVNETWAKENGYTQEEAETNATTSSNTYSLTSTSGGNETTTTTDGTTVLSYDSQTRDTESSTTGTTETGSEFDVEVSGKYSTEASASAGIGGTSASVKAGYEISGSVEYSNYDKNTTSDTLTRSSETHSGSDTTTVDTTVSDSTSSWNTSASSSASTSSTQSKTVSTAISEVISEAYGYSTSSSTGGEVSDSQAFSNSQSTGNDYYTALAYSTQTSTTTTSTYTTDGKTEGIYRLVMAGTVHVFAVVGYDVASQAYFTYTYCVMDENYYEFLDYTYDATGSFEDNESGAIPFEVPYEVYEYVEWSTAQTEGLNFSVNSSTMTATVRSYTGDSTDVYIPSYITSGGKSYQVTSISATAFAGQDITAIVLGKYIDAIPDGAFKNCTSLTSVSGYFTTIGDEAFSGCTSLTDFTVSYAVTSIGENAFSGVPVLTVNALSEAFALEAAEALYPDAEDSEWTAYAGELTQQLITEALSTGADQITLNLAKTIDVAGLTLNVPEITYFELQGSERTYNELQINSNATTTVLVDTTVNNSSAIPLRISSANLTLDNVIVYSASYDMVSSADTLTVSLLGNSKFYTDNGISVVSRNLTFEALVRDRVVGDLQIYGDIYVCGTVTGLGDIEYYNVVYLTEEEYAKYQSGMYTVTFDANGGETDETSRELVYGEAIGTLPEATWEGHTFLGWFTEDGTQVTEDWVSEDTNDVTLYAQWEVDSYTATWSTGTGYTITVTRTSSPYEGAATGTISSGATVYYGDVLSVTYAASTGYTLGSTGATSITVTGDVTSNDIYASATANSYTYNIKYVSENGTDLGSTTATYTYGTTHTISAPTKSGYDTPSSQSVKWDSTTAKTITFTYPVTPQSTTQTASSGTWYTWTDSGSTYGITYKAELQWQNRTSTTIQVRVKWTNTIYAYCWYGYGQYFTPTIAGTTGSKVTIASSSTWSSSSSSSRSVTVYSDWVTVSVAATKTSISTSATWSDQNSKSGSWSKTMTIPTY